MPDPTELMQYLPTFQQVVFVMIAGFVAVAGLATVFADNLFHSALGLVATLFGVAGIFVLLEAEFVAVSQVLVYVGAISTLITFAIMLTRGMMFGRTAVRNRQWLASLLLTLFSAWRPWASSPILRGRLSLRKLPTAKRLSPAW